MDSYNNVKIKKATGFFERFIGLMFKRNIKYGLFFKNCRAIHTFFMLESIDLIATDENDQILKKYKNVKPWKILILPKEVKNIYELPKDTI